MKEIKVYRYNKFYRVLPSNQRVADLVFRLNGGWLESRVAEQRGIRIEEVRAVREFYESNRGAIDAEIARIYSCDGTVTVPDCAYPLHDEKGNVVGWTKSEELARKSPFYRKERVA